MQVQGEKTTKKEIMEIYDYIAIKEFLSSKGYDLEIDKEFKMKFLKDKSDLTWEEVFELLNVWKSENNLTYKDI